MNRLDEYGGLSGGAMDAGRISENALAVRDEPIWRLFLRYTRECVLDIDFKTPQIRCSAALVRCFRLTGETLPRTAEQWLELYHPDDYDKSLEFRRIVFDDFGEPGDFGKPDETGKPGETVFSLERRLYCGDGLYRWFRLDAFCLRGETGGPERLVGVETDLFPAEFQEEPHTGPLSAGRDAEKLGKKLAALEAEKKRLLTWISQESLAREAAERRARLLAQMLDTSSDSLFCRNADGRVTVCNAPFANLAARDPGLAAWAGALSDVSGEDPADLSYRYEDAHGRTRLLSARLAPLADDDKSAWNRRGEGRLHENSAGGILGALSDVTDAAETEADMTRLRGLLGIRVLLNLNREPAAGSLTGLPDLTDSPNLPDSPRKTPAEGDSQGPALELPEGVFEGSRQSSGDFFEKFERIFGGALEDALEKLLPAAGFFPTRAAQIGALLRAAEGEAELEAGVVGITSSGKSTLINALMGERLLPEETRATTNLMIRCRKGAERFVAVVSKDGTRTRVSGANLTAAWMESLSSERMNPGNEKDVALLEWSSPGALLPEGLVLIDTPGLDAHGFPEHSELVLRRLLPALDIVLYVTSIRNRLKAADLGALNAVLEQNQRIVFLLSQIDLEQDDTEGGRVVLSRRRKLSAYVRELREDIGRAGGAYGDEAYEGSAYEGNAHGERGALSGSAILPVSSKLALERFYDRNSAEWRASNFDALIGQLKDFRAGLKRYRAGTRARRAAALLSRSARDLELVLEERGGRFGKTREKIKEKIRGLRDAQRWVNAEVSAVRNEWRRLLDPEYHLKYLEREIGSANTVKGVKDRYERWSAGCSGLAARMTARMDRARRACREMLQKHGVVPGSRDWSVPEIGEERGGLPVFHRYVFQKPREVQVRGWFESLCFWPRYRTFFRQDVDKGLMMESARELLAERMRLLNGHLSWWENKMREDCCDPLFEELSREEAAMADAGRAAAEESASQSALLQALESVREAESVIRNALSGFSGLESKEADAPEPEEEFFDGLPHPGENLADAEGEGKNLFAPLLTAFREQDIQERFLRLDALRGGRRVVLLGLRRHDSLRLLSRLAHDAAFSDSLRTEDGKEIDEREWIFCGSTPPALPHVRAAAPDTLLRELEILVAPSDALCSEEALRREGRPPVDWNDLFAEWLPVIHLDIARIDSGLSDLARAPYVHALPNARRWVAASGQGALFNARLSDLLTDVPDRVDLFTWRRDCKERAEWFVYENYDARYTDFMLWGREIADRREEGARLAGALLRKWKENGYGFTPPFSESRIRLALLGGRRPTSPPGQEPAARGGVLC